MIRRILEFFTTSLTGISGRVDVITRRWRSTYRTPTQSWARSDYAFWRRAYYGQVVGLELSGLLIKPLVGVVSAWTLGRPPRWKLEDADEAQQMLTDWWANWHPTILQAWRSALREGDAFLVINSDSTITLLPPDAVDPIVDDTDFGTIIGWRVTQVFAHPESSQRQTVVDEYYADRRVHTVEIQGVVRSTQEYPNLLEQSPFIHIANQANPGDHFGHAEAEALLGLMHKYGEVFDAAVEGNILQGRPTPVLTFATVADLEKFDEENASFDTQSLPNGQSQRVKTYEVDLSQLLVASGATFQYASPGSFTTDTAKLLELMFYLFLQHSQLPEFVFGNAISSSKASAETQLPVFIEYIKARRGEMVEWLTTIAEIAMEYMSLTTPGMAMQTPTLQWEALDQEDGTLTLETVKWGLLEGLLDRRTALQLAPIEVDDIDAVLDSAEAEAEANRVQFPETQPDEGQFDRDLAAQIDQLELD